MIRRANKWVYDGKRTAENKRGMSTCSAHHEASNTSVVFARDSGHYSGGGGYKSQASDRCFHLALTFLDFENGIALPPDPKKTREWLNAFFPGQCHLLWAEAPVDLGAVASFWRWCLGLKMGDALFWHFRLFCDENWQPLTNEPALMQRDMRARGFVRASELSFGEKLRRPRLPLRLWKRLSV